MYSVLGYYLANKDFKKNQRIAIYVLGIFGFLINFLGTAMLTNPQNDINDLFRGAFNWPCLLQTAAFFIFFKYVNISFKYEKLNKKIEDLIEWFSTKTFGVYLLHIYLVWEIPIHLGISTYSLLWRVLGGVLIFMVCSFIISILQKIPLVKNIVP